MCPYMVIIRGSSHHIEMSSDDDDLSREEPPIDSAHDVGHRSAVVRTLRRERPEGVPPVPDPAWVDGGGVVNNGFKMRFDQPCGEGGSKGGMNHYACVQGGGRRARERERERGRERERRRHLTALDHDEQYLYPHFPISLSCRTPSICRSISIPSPKAATTAR